MRIAGWALVLGVGGLAAGLGLALPAQEAGAGARLAALAGGAAPGRTPQLFGAGRVSTGLGERDLAVSPAGDEVFFSVMTGRTNTILWTRWQAGRWTEARVAPFAEDGRYFHMEPCFDPDGQRVYFLSTRPPAGQAPKPGWGHQNIWVSRKTPDGGWGEAVELEPGVINVPGGGQYFPSMTRAGTLYFTRVEANGKPAVYRAERVNGRYLRAERLPAEVNREGTSPYNAAVSPDERMLVVAIDGREVSWNPGRPNYWLFLRQGAGWTEGTPLGREINVPGSPASSASFSPDGRFLFFGANVTDERFAGERRPRTLAGLLEMAASVRNGGSDIYWVAAELP